MAATLVKNTKAPAGVNAGVSTGTNVGASGVTPYDSGNIKRTNFGNGSLTVKIINGAGVPATSFTTAKLTDGTQQSATVGTSGVATPTSQVDNNFIGVAEDPTYRGRAAGYSILGE
ncbi:MAG: hypothetical protein C5B59_08755 [Bacteroidetes bacterium]|nr:MAG: hypothetical protein C5B59_08755 [Bacteroidota bacterium]